MKRAHAWSGWLAALAVVVAAGDARAEGAVIGPDKLAPGARGALLAAIGRERARDASAFAAVRAVGAALETGVDQSRNHRPSTAAAFMGLGRGALVPMLELAAVSAERGRLGDAEWRALGEGLLQAIGALRDPRAAPVLAAAFAGATDPVLAERAAEGLGALCRPVDRALLASRADAGDPLRAAAVAGLGRCRVAASVQRLAAIMAEPLDEETAAKVARALGYVGSSWALRADGTVPDAEADAIRRAAARALVDAYRRHGGAAREAIARALLMVEHPASVGWLAEAARASGGDDGRALARLGARLETNLARAPR